MNPRPIETALLICMLFCLPRIVIPGRPVPDTPQIMVRIPAEGLSKEQVRRSMQGLVEEELRTLSGQIHVETESAQAELLLRVRFPRGTPVLAGISRVQQSMSRIQNRLPYQASRPIITPLPSEPPFLKLCCSLKPQTETIRNLELAQLQEQLQRNPNIQRALVSGFGARRIVIRLDPEKLSRLRISPLYIQQYLQHSLFHFYSGVQQEEQREIGVEMQSSIADITDLKQLELPIPRSSGTGTHIIRLQELASVELQELRPTHFIATSDFSFAGGATPTGEGEWRVAEISIQGSHHLQLFQQLILFRYIRQAVQRTDVVQDITFNGGTYFSVIGAVVLLCAFFSAGLLLSACLSSPPTPHDNGTIWQYLLSWALVLGLHTLFQIPLTPSRCIGICIAVPGITVLLSAAARPWLGQIVDLCVITLASAALITGLGITLHDIVDGAVQQGIRNSLTFHSSLLRSCPSGALFARGTLNYAQVLQGVCWFFFCGILLSGMRRIPLKHPSLSSKLHPRVPLGRLIPLFILIGLLAGTLLILPSPRSYFLKTSLPPQNACLALSSHFRSRFPPALFSAGVPQYSHIERCSTASEYWELRVHPQHISIDCLISPLTALRGLSALHDLSNPGNLISLGNPAGARRKDSDSGQSIQPRRFNLEIKQKDSPFATASHHEFYSHLQLSVAGNKIGSLPDTQSVSAQIPVHLYYGRSSTVNELAALPIFIDSIRGGSGNSSVPLGELCDISQIAESEAE
ncbi:MAG: efflux RND transporter permease subunit [Spirochaetia bacterium]